MRKTLAVVLSALMLMTACCFALPVSAAEGTAINTAEEFAAMAADGTYYLNADITISASYANSFTGTFDGNGKTVTVSAPMFAELNGTVKNLAINGNITAIDDAGAVACHSTAGCAVENVVNNVNVTVMSDLTHAAAGGIIGTDEGNKNISYYTNIINNGDIYCDSSVEEDANPRAAGIGGIVDNAVFTRCINNGDITAIGSASKAAGIAARLAQAPVGVNTAEAYYCVNNGTVTGTDHVDNTTACDGGGIFAHIGDKSNTAFYRVYGCLNTGDIYGSHRGSGIVCYAYGSTSNQFLDIEFCVNTGNITYGKPLINGDESVSYGSHFIAYTNSSFTSVKYNISTGTCKPADFAVVSNHGFIAMSNADALMYDVSDNYILEGCMESFTHTYWNKDKDFAERPDNRQDINYGAENGLWTIVTAEELASGKIAVALNEEGKGYDGYYFYQTIGTDAIPTVQDTSKWVIDNGGVYVNGEKPVEEKPVVTTPVEDDPVDEPDVTTPVEDENDTTTPPAQDDTTTPPAQGDTTTPAPKDPESGCGSVVALSILACMIPAAVVICKKKRD